MMRKLFHHYTLIAEVEQGYLHTVYIATAGNNDDQKVVLTVFAPTLYDQSVERALILLRAEAIRRLKHPHILPLLDIKLHDKQFYTVRAYLPDYIPLRQRCNDLTDRRLDWQAAVAIIIQAGQALAYAHQQQVPHGHLTPSCILLDKQDQIVLTDFDLVPVDKSTYDRSIEYMAPEQFMGTSDPLSDQYALGCIAYELLSGKRPFAVQRANGNSNPGRFDLPLPLAEQDLGIPTIVANAVRTTMAQDAEARYTGIGAFIQALNSALALANATDISSTTQPATSVAKTALSTGKLAVVTGEEATDQLASPQTAYATLKWTRKEQLPTTLIPDMVTPIPEIATDPQIPVQHSVNDHTVFQIPAETQIQSEGMHAQTEIPQAENEYSKPETQTFKQTPMMLEVVPANMWALEPGRGDANEQIIDARPSSIAGSDDQTIAQLPFIPPLPENSPVIFDDSLNEYKRSLQTITSLSQSFEEAIVINRMNTLSTMVYTSNSGISPDPPATPQSSYAERKVQNKKRPGLVVLIATIIVFVAISSTLFIVSRAAQPQTLPTVNRPDVVSASTTTSAPIMSGIIGGGTIVTPTTTNVTATSVVDNTATPSTSIAPIKKATGASVPVGQTTAATPTKIATSNSNGPAIQPIVTGSTPITTASSPPTTSNMPIPTATAAPVCTTGSFTYSVTASDASTAIFWFKTCNWSPNVVIVHTTSPEHGALNNILTYNASTARWEYVLIGLQKGDIILYNFTYQNAGNQADTANYTWQFP